jgi:hypothetical protein
VAAAELAVIVPLFAILLLGVIEVGSMTREHQVLQNAAREGARFSAMASNRISGAPAVESRIKDRIVAYLQNERITLDPDDITINQNYVMRVNGVTVLGSEITITYQRHVMFTGVSNWIALGPISTLRSRAVFRNFY